MKKTLLLVFIHGFKVCQIPAEDLVPRRITDFSSMIFVFGLEPTSTNSDYRVVMIPLARSLSIYASLQAEHFLRSRSP